MKDVGFEQTMSKNTHGEYPRRGRRPRTGMFLSILLMLTTAICACDEPTQPSGGGATPPNCAGYIVDGKCVELTTCQDNSGCTVNGEYCYGGYCQKSDRICTLLDCDNKPGVCSAEEGKCVNAETCRPGQNDCLTGSYCDASNKCSEGGCMKADGTPCESVCQSYKDCGDGTCVDDKCTVAAACEADLAEPNDAPQDSFSLGNEVGPFTLCNGDVDWYTAWFYSGSPNVTQLGVQVDIDPADVGLKTVTVEVYNEKKGKVAETSNVVAGKHGNKIEFTLPPDDELYYFKVYSNDTETRPLRYSIAHSQIYDGAEAQCKKAKTLEFGKTIKGKVLAENRPLLSCQDHFNEYPKDIYQFTLKRRSLLDISMSSKEEFNIDIRPSCLISSRRGALHQQFCVDSYDLAHIRESKRVFEPGDYYLIVTGKDQTQESAYSLLVDVAETSCTLAAATCQDGVLKTCATNFSNFTTVNCPNGCNDAGDGCKLPEGDSCQNPIVIDATTDFSKEYILSTFSDQIKTGRQCLQQASNTRDLTDMVFAVEVPKGKTLHFQATPLEISNRHRVNYLVYMVEGCQQTAYSCLRGKEGRVDYGSISERGELYWKNIGETKTVYIVVEGSIRELDKFRVDARISDLRCEPNTIFCHADRELLQCGKKGTAVLHISDCQSLGCSKETNRCLPPEKGDTCEKPQELKTDGTVVQLPLEGLTNAVSSPLQACADKSATGYSTYSEAVFKFTVEENSDYTVNIRGDENMVAWLADTCSATQETCLTARRFEYNTSISLKTGPGESGPRYLFAESRSQFNRHGVLEVSVKKNRVVPGGGVPACNNSNEIVYYDQDDVERTYSCEPRHCIVGRTYCGPGSMRDGSCFKAQLEYQPGDSQSGYITLDSHTNINKFLQTYNVPASCTVSFKDTQSFREGSNEYYYRFELGTGDSLSIDIRNLPGFAFLQKENDCGKNNACISSVTKYMDGDNGALLYKAGSNEVVNLVVVREEGRRMVPTDIVWKIGKSIECIVNQSYCADNKNLIACDSSGHIINKTTCPGKCEGNACLVEKTAAAACSSPINVENGLTYMVEAKSTVGTQNPKACLMGLDASGPETYFKVSAKKGDYIQVHARNDNTKLPDPILYITDDCNNISTSCHFGRVRRLGFYAPKNGEYFVVLDYNSETIEAETKTYISFNITESTCTPAPPTCAGGEINLCAYGQPVVLTCDSGACGTTQGQCSVPQGFTCADAIDLNKQPNFFTYKFASEANKTSQLILDDEAFGSCLFAPLEGHIHESFFKVTLAANEMLSVRVEGEGPFNMFLTDTCDLDTCRQSSIQSHEYENTLRYTSKSGGTYYLVIQAPNNYGNRVRIEKRIGFSHRQCARGQTSCENATTLVACDRAGDEFKISCACEDGRCKVDKSDIDTCTTAPEVTGGFHGIVPLPSLTNDDDGSLTCGSGYSDGADAYYKVVLQPYEKLSATLYPSRDHVRPSLYLFNDCAKIADTCLADDEKASGNYAEATTLDYRAGNAQETVYLGVDGGERTTSARLTIKVDQPFCKPTDDVCAGGTLTYCNEDFAVETFTCRDSVACDGTNKKCQNPSGLICQDAIPAALGTEMSGSFASSHHRVNFPLAESCTGSTTNGAEFFYSVTVPAGKTLTVKVTSDADEDLALYLAKSCLAIKSTCIAGVDESNGKSETLTYTAGATDEHLILGVDSYQASNVGTFKIKFEIAQ